MGFWWDGVGFWGDGVGFWWDGVGFGGMEWVFGGMEWVFGGMEWVFGVGGFNLFSLKTKLSQTGEIGITNITGPQTHYI